jgi:hypothetical protein
METLAWAIAITMARVAAMWRLDAPRWSIMARVATGAAKLTKLICRAAKTPRPVRPTGRRPGESRATTQSSTPRASSKRISDSMTTITGSSTKKDSSTAERPARRMTSISRSMVAVQQMFRRPRLSGAIPLGHKLRRTLVNPASIEII